MNWIKVAQIQFLWWTYILMEMSLQVP